jgi:hypothetical protein
VSHDQLDAEAMDREERLVEQRDGHAADAAAARIEAHRAQAEADKQHRRAVRAERRVRKLERAARDVLTHHICKSPHGATCSMCRLAALLETK